MSGTAGAISSSRSGLPTKRAVRRLIGLLLVAALVACDEPPPPAPVAPELVADPGITLVRGICLDASGSSPASFSERVRARLVKRIKAWVPDTVDRERVQSPALPGLAMVVRAVATNSPSTNDEYSLIITIPSVPELPAPPDVQARNFQDLRHRYVEQQNVVRTRRAAARTKAEEGAKALAEFSLIHERSGITACASVLAINVADLAKTVPKPQDRSFMIASDLQDNEPRQVDGDYEHAPITLLQTCPNGDLAHCDKLADRLSRRLRPRRAGPITRIRAELIDRTVDAWLGQTP
jgi:hypothetical protein